MKIFIIVFCLGLSHLLSAQNAVGVVFTQESNVKIPVVGANVYWEKTTLGVVTNTDGKFLLLKSQITNSLVISHVGYVSDTIVWVPNVDIEVVLKPKGDLDEVVVFQKATGAWVDRINPIHTQHVSGVEFQRAACCNLSESFETNPSVDVAYSDATTGAKQIKLLGLSGTYSQIQTENYPNLRGLATNYGLTFVPGSWMESIQISKGAASVVNGYESITGQINVEYKKPDSKEKFFLNLFGSADGEMELNGNIDFKVLPKLSTVFFYNAKLFNNMIDHNNDGFLDHPLNQNLHFMNRWEYKHKNAHTQLGFKYMVDERTGGQLDFKRNNEMQNGNPYGIGIDAERTEVFFKSGGFFFDGHASIGVISSYAHHQLNSFYGKINYNATEDNFYSNLIVKLQLDEHDRHTISFGSSFLLNKINETFVQNSLKNEQVPGLFAEYTYKLDEKVTAMMGIRSDFHNMFGTFYTPRMHLRYQPSHAVTIRASAGKGSRTANLISENSYLFSSNRLPSFSTNYFREEAWNTGASILQNYTLFGRKLELNLEFYHTNFLKQAIVDMESSASEVIISPLQGKSFSNSVQADLKYELFKRFDLLLAFRYNEVKQTIGGVLVDKPLTSKYKGLITLNYATNLKKWMFDYTLQLNGGGRMPITPGVPHNFMVDQKFSPFSIMNLQATRYFKFGSIYAGAENLTDFIQHNTIISASDVSNPWFDATKIWGPVLGRRIYIGFRYQIKSW